MAYEQVETVKIVDPDNSADFIVLAASAYTPAVHTLWQEASEGSGPPKQEASERRAR